MLRKLLLTSIMCLFGFATAFAQSGTLTGTVTDSNSGETLPGANVYIPSIQKGDNTDADGEYTITNIPAGTYTVRFSYVGFQTVTQEVEISSGSTATLDITLTAGINLDQVVVTGYGEVQRRSFTGSASSVSSEDINEVPVADVGQALQGKVAGASITSATGTPGAVQQIRVRGISSINAGVEPLYVIDGVPVVSGSNAASTATSSLGVLSNLSPSDIENVTILKDPASTAPYGARGANGVVVITTKSGRSGDVTYSLNTQVGYNNPAVDKPGSLDATQYTDLAYQTYANNFNDALGLNIDPTTDAGRSQIEQIAAANGIGFAAANWNGQTNTDWQDVIGNDNAAQQSYGLSARGGNDRTTFYASGNYFKQEGQNIASQLNRVSGKLNIEHDLDDRITVKNNFTGSYVNQDGILEGAGYFGSPVLAQYFMLPIDPAFNDDGEANITNLSNAIFNPVYTTQNDINSKRNYRLLNNTDISFAITENFTASTNFAVDFLLTEEKYYDNPVYGDGQADGGRVDDIDNRNFNYVWRNSLGYIWDLNAENNFRFRLLSESQRNYYKFLEGYGLGVAAQGLYNLNTTATPQAVGSVTTDWAIQSFTGLVNYSFQDKMYLDLSLRREGNSRFAEDERWGTFYSIGAAYTITEEEFMDDINWLNQLKFRASFGKTGNSSIGLNQYQAVVGFSDYNNQSTIFPAGLGNRSLTWENQYAYEAGIDFTMFERLNGSITGFRKEGTELLFGVPLSRTTGFNSQTQNLGELYNQGIEIELSTNIIRTDDFSWNLGGNFTTLKNEITDLPDDPNGENRNVITGTRYIAEEGFAVNSWYMREWAGVDPDNGDPLWFMDDGNGGRTTTNNYNEADRYYQGANAQPTTYGGVNTRFDVMGFYASADLYYAFGHKVYDDWAFVLRSDGAFTGTYNQYESQLDYWQEPGDQAENPRPVRGGNLNSNGTSSRYLYDGDFLRLKTLRVGYNIPVTFLDNVGLKSANIYFLGQNLWTHKFDEDLELDPEVNADGFTALRAAPIKSVTFGINVNF